MAITQNLTRVRIESGAKNGTLGSQSASPVLAANQIKFDTAITTNNSNLEASPSFKWRHVILRRDGANEEFNMVQSVEGDGLTCNMYTNWDVAPALGDTYDIAYKLEDAATVDGCSFETDSRQWVMAKRLIIGDATNFGFFGISHGQFLRCFDTGGSPELTAFRVGVKGIFNIGTIDKNDLAERGAQVIFDHNADGELVMDWLGGSRGRLYEFGMHSGRGPDGITGLRVTFGSPVDVEWARVQTSGMDSPFTKNYYRCYRDWAGTGANILSDTEILTVGDIKNMAFYNAWCHSELDQSIKDAIASEADTARLRIIVEN